jgi:hypothetical protein
MYETLVSSAVRVSSDVSFSSNRSPLDAGLGDYLSARCRPEAAPTMARETPPAASSWRSVRTPPSPASAAFIAPNRCAALHPHCALYPDPSQTLFAELSCVESAGSSPSHAGQVSGFSITGSGSRRTAHELVVMIAKLRTHSPAGERQFSHRPASAIGRRSSSAIAYGCLPFAVFFHS